MKLQILYIIRDRSHYSESGGGQRLRTDPETLAECLHNTHTFCMSPVNQP